MTEMRSAQAPGFSCGGDVNETPWPIDHEGQTVLVEAAVYALPDPDDEDPDRYYTFDIPTGNGLRTLATIRADHVRDHVHRIPEPPAEPTMVRADRLAGFEVELFGGWYSVETVTDAGDGFVTINLHCESMIVTLNGGDLIPARLPEE